ncbi:MAG TPA: hypothetical protein VMW69_16395 [Spirochaetia bacterium]|nr:hypothetical protein [Spirochaetia bacterium]
MKLPERSGDWGRLAGYAGLALVLYYLSALETLFFLFAVPLQVAYAKRGRTQYWIASVVVLVGIGLFSLWRSSIVTGGNMRFLLVSVEVAVNLLIVVGLDIVNVTWSGVQRKLYRLLIATGIAGVVSLPFVLMLAASSEFAAVMRNQVAQVVTMLDASFGAGSNTLAHSLNVDEILSYVRQVALGNYLFMFFLILTGVWRIGAIFAARSSLRRPAPLARFVLPVEFLWPILVAWGGVLADRLLHLGAFGYVAWNLAMIGAFLYGLQGVGIVQFLFARFHIGRGFRLLIVVVLLFLVLFPGVGMVVAIAFPILGISELWVRYGRGAVNQ